MLSRLRQLITDDDGRLQRTQEFQISSKGDCLQQSNDMTSPVAAAFKHIASLQQLRLIFFDRQGRMQHSYHCFFTPRLFLQLKLRKQIFIIVRTGISLVVATSAKLGYDFRRRKPKIADQTNVLLRTYVDAISIVARAFI